MQLAGVPTRLESFGLFSPDRPGRHPGTADPAGFFQKHAIPFIERINDVD
jgi:hypothetical protein